MSAGVHTTVAGSKITNNNAWLGGGGICTSLHVQLGLELKTPLVVDAVLLNNSAEEQLDPSTPKQVFSGIGSTVWAGPSFNLSFGSRSHVHVHSEGVLWQRTLCDRGEYLAASGYCEPCPAYTFTLDEWHNNAICQRAPNSTTAPGGAVFVPYSGYWHGHATSNELQAGKLPSGNQLKTVKQ